MSTEVDPKNESLDVSAPTGASASDAAGPSAAATAAAAAAAVAVATNPHASASLYVGDLHPDITEAALFEIFSAVGPVASIRVCRDVVTRRSLGYGYVNFHNVVDAERALDTMNFYVSAATKDRPLRLMWKHRDPSVRKVGTGNVFIKNLAKTIDNKSLYDTFSTFGNIMSCKVAIDDKGNSLGYGFVHFENGESAEMAIKHVNGKIIEGRKVFVGPFLPKKDREASGDANKTFTNVYVKNIDPEQCSEEKIRELFSPFGTITSIFVPQDEAGKPKGFAFVNYDNPSSASKACEELDGTEMSGKQLYVGRAQRKGERENELKNKFEQLKYERIQKHQGVNLYVKNLSDEIDDEKLRQEFSKHGTITSCKIMTDDKGNSKGFGFVCFSLPEEATKAVTELNGALVGKKPIYVALAQRKDVRQAQLEAQRNMGLRGIGGPVPPVFQPGVPLFYAQEGMAPPMHVQPGGRGGQPQFVNPQYMGMGAAPVGRGGVPAGWRGGPMPQGAMGRGGYPVNMVQQQPGSMNQYGMMQGRQQRGGRGGQQSPGMGGVPRNNGAPMQAGRGGMNRGMAGMQQQQQQQQQQQFKYTVNARNAGGVGPAAQVPDGVQAAANGAPVNDAAAQGQLTLEMLANASPEQQKQLLGERLYPMVSAKEPQMSGKITGMILEMDNSEILHLLESPSDLSDKIEEAVQVLRAHAAAAAAGADQK